LPSVLNVALAGVALGVAMCSMLRQTAPKKSAAPPLRSEVE
jgi:hypothetical protein